MVKALRRTTFGLIVGTRGFFPASLAVEARKQILAELERLGYGYVIPPAEATPNGVIETAEDARKCAAAFKEQRDEIDGVIVILPNFGDEIGVGETLSLSRLDVPVLVQACDDDLDRLDLAHRRDAFCGKISVCNNLYQLGIPFTNTATHTCAIGSLAFQQDLDFFARVCRVVRGLRNARIGAVGARPNAFRTMRASEKLLQASGLTVLTVDLSEIIAAASSMDDEAQAVRRRIEEMRDYGEIAAEVAPGSLAKHAKLALALGDWVDRNEIDACAVQCWSSLQENYGCGVCLALSMLGERRVPAACETDVAGAVSMYSLLLAAGEIPALLDWNNNFGEERDLCINTHCSNYPRSFMGSRPEIGNLDVLGTQLGADRCFGAVKGYVAPGPMTYARISTDDRAGKIKAYVGEGDFTGDRPRIDGGIAVCHVPRLQELLDFICRNGFEHHVAMVRTHCAGVIEEAFRTYLGWEITRHR